MEYVVRRENNIIHPPPLQFPQDGNKGLGYFIYESFKKHGDKIFQIDCQTGQTETYSSLLEKSIRVAMEMTKMGIKKGDVISICSKNSMESVIPFFASTFLNTVLAGIDPSLSARDSVYLINLVQPKVMFVEPTVVSFIEGIYDQLSSKPRIIVMGHYEKYSTFTQILKAKDGEELFKPVAVKDPNDMTAILFSSGTTGLPKAIKSTHYGFMHAIYSLRQMDVRGNASFHMSSFYWITAYFVTLLTILDGGYKVINSIFDPAIIAKIFVKYKITFAFMTSNSAYQFTKEHTAIYETSVPANIYFGGGPLTDEQLCKCRTYFPNALVSQGYGQSEALNFITLFSKTLTPKLAEKYPGSCGVPIPGTSIKIVDPDTEVTLPPNQQGEIRILSKGTFLGYDNEDNSRVFDSDGFLKTGDIGYFNDDNCLYVSDRLREMFKYQCWHIIPALIEKVVYQHPAVKEAVVLGLPHREDGDHPMALVVLQKDHSNVNEEDIQEFVNSRVSEREKLRGGVRFVPALPRTLTGKIIRRQIRNAVLEGTL